LCPQVLFLIRPSEGGDVSTSTPAHRALYKLEREMEHLGEDKEALLMMDSPRLITV